MTASHPVKLKPGDTIGILGGGQLGRMLAMAAARLGLRCQVFSPDPDSPAFDVVLNATCAEYADVEEPIGGLRTDVVAIVRQDCREPGRLAWPFHGVHLGLTPSRVQHDEPDQPGSHDEPDDEQPYIELGIHRAEVYGASPLHFGG